MNIDFFGNNIRAETDGLVVSLNDLFNAGNVWRLTNGKPAYQMATFLNSQAVSEYVEAAAEEWGIGKDKFIYKVGKGNKTRTMVHVSVAILAAECISPAFHAKVHRVFIEGKLLEFRELGGTEFKNLNACIDMYLPDRIGKDNKGVYITIAKLLRAKVLGADAQPGDWDKCSVAQTHTRYDFEKRLCDYLKQGFITSFQQLKDTIGRL